MIVENEKVCYNCRHCTREWNEDGTCCLHCDINEDWVEYAECFQGLCKHWAKEDEQDDQTKN